MDSPAGEVMNHRPSAQDTGSVDMLQETEMKELRRQWDVERDDLIKKYMGLLTNICDPDEWTETDEAKSRMLKELDSKHQRMQQELEERYQRSKHLAAVYDQQVTGSPAVPAPPSNNAAQPVPPEESVAGPKTEEVNETSVVMNEVPSLEPRGLSAAVMNRENKRKAEPELSNEPKRPRPSTDPPAHVHDVLTPTPGSARSEQPSTTDRTITYQEVRRRATEDGHWDTIVEYPSGTKKWYILDCAEHGVHFKQSAIAAAAKHLHSSSHQFPDRNQKVALATLGSRVVDCTVDRRASHNAEVDLAFKHGYLPQNILQGLGKRVNYPFEKMAPGLASTPFASPTGQVYERPKTKAKSSGSKSPKTLKTKNKSSSGSNAGEHSSSRSQTITHPKLYHIYYSDFAEEEDGERRNTVWPVLLLGWDDLTPGGDIPVRRLVDTALLEKRFHPPRCYIYNDQRDKIVNWAQGYEDGGNPLKLAQRKFPVMFFDGHYSYAWVTANALSRFPIEKKNAPKKRGYSERAFNEARNFIAKREGYRNWEERERARRAGRLGRRDVNGTRRAGKLTEFLVPWQPGPSRLSHAPRPGNFEFQSPYEGPAEKLTPSQYSATDDSESEDNELRKLEERGGEISGDEDYRTSNEDDDEENTTTSKDSFSREKVWPSPYRLRSEDQLGPHSRSPSIAETILKDQSLGKNDQSPRAASIPSAAEAPVQKLTAKRTGKMPHHRASMPFGAKPPVQNNDPTTAASGTEQRQNPPSGSRPATSSAQQENASNGPKPSTPSAQQQNAPTNTRPSASSAQQENASNGTKPSTPSAQQADALRDGAQSSKTAARPADGLYPTAALSGVPASNGDDVAIPSKTHRFELSLYDSDGTHWMRKSPHDSGVKLDEVEAGVLQCHGGPVTFRIGAAEWGALHLKPIAGNSIITITRADGNIMKMMFDRKKDDEETPSGKVQARNFINWLRDARRRQSLTLTTSSD